MIRLETIAVIGLGVIGGSVARGLAACGIRILGHDIDSSHLDAAISEGSVSRRLSPGMEDVDEADAVVIAVYGDAALDVLRLLAPRVGQVELITDVGSTKQTIVAAAEQLGLGSRFVGSHPYAGDHRSGWEASRSDLFANETVYLCPAAEAGPGAVAHARELWTCLGATPTIIDAAVHDELMAWTSHLPHLVSTALALALADAGIARSELGRGGRDVTRLAGGSPKVWTAIAADNAERIEAAVAGIELQLRNLREALRTNDSQGLSDRFVSAREWSGS